jgi:hypothetical protein
MGGRRLRMSSAHAAFIAWELPRVTYRTATADSR